ncbi:MAG TPA: hypothetical protein VEO53_11860, partial [Candidatus Binatia bacterium]|nr:hypothetical protein [Candidatus Binatia bacterium]
MPTIRHCATCGAALTGTPDGQCPECLIQLGLKTGAEHGEVVSGPALAPLPRPFGDYELLEEIAR